jgi:hypothetical protein
MDQPAPSSIQGRECFDSVCPLKLKDFSSPERKNPRAMRHKCAETRERVGKKDRIGAAALANSTALPGGSEAPTQPFESKGLSVLF